MDFGSVTQTPFATYDPDSSSWRTWEHFLFEDSTSFSGRWPNSGMTHDGRAYELPTSALPTSETACSSSVSRGTPSARAANLLPTPRGQNGEPRNNKVWARPLDQPQNLENALALLPTPIAGDAKSARNSTATRTKIPPTGVHAGDTLTDILVPKKSTGAATKSPSGDGSPSPDQPPPP